jgi:hypothetical protein
MKWVLLAAGVFVAWYLVWTVYLAIVLRWEDDATVGLGYYGKSRPERERFKRRLRFHALLLSPLLWLNGRLTKLDFRKTRVVYDGVAFPPGSCDAASIERALRYRPGPDDIFVVTQMKCGTTWMQHVVYEVLRRGHGDLVETGTPLYALSPWLEGRRSVAVGDAPLLGVERPSRIIKTHLPAQLCPRAREARYIYVARHPVSCFASCLDFVATNVGAMTPSLSACEAWFTSPELMWWGTWTDHVKGWTARAAADDNVLVLHFEDMKRDLAAVVTQVARFLGVRSLTDTELGAVVRKTSFAYMQEHQDTFEMHPPHILQTNAALFVRGSIERHQDVPAATRERVLAWAKAGMGATPYPL